MWALFVPWLRWVPYGTGAAIGYAYAVAGGPLWAPLAMLAALGVWRFA